MNKLFGKELNIGKAWKKLDSNQRFSLSVLLFLLISFPVSLLLSLSPVRLFSRAQLPATPPISVTPTPTYPNKISWNTPYVELDAYHFEILTGGGRFQAIVDDVDIHSDPGHPTYTTLEAIWYENGVEMRMFMYFKADGNNWWLDELRTYDGLNPGDWIFYEVGWENQSLLVKGRLGTPFNGDIRLYSRSDQAQRGMVILTGLNLLPFAHLVTPTPTFTPTPIADRPPRCGTPTIRPATGPAPLTVTLHGGGAMGSAGLMGYQWDFENDGIWDTDLEGINLDPVTHIYTKPGVYQPKFRVFDVNGNSSPVCDYLFDVVVEESSVTPTPSVSAIPSFRTRYLKPGMSGRKYKTLIRGEDMDRDKLTMTASGLPKGVDMKGCAVTYTSKVSRITCEISGVPQMSGIYRTQFELRDDTGAGVTANYTLVILPKFLP